MATWVARFPDRRMVPRTLTVSPALSALGLAAFSAWVNLVRAVYWTCNRMPLRRLPCRTAVTERENPPLETPTTFPSTSNEAWDLGGACFTGGALVAPHPAEYPRIPEDVGTGPEPRYV